MTKIYLGYTVHTGQDLYGPVKMTDQVNGFKAYLGSDNLEMKQKFLSGVPVKVFMYHDQTGQKLSSVDSQDNPVTYGPILIFGARMWGITDLPEQLVDSLDKQIEIRCVRINDETRLTHVLHGLDDKMQVDLI
jgi:hypothetical protein